MYTVLVTHRDTKTYGMTLTNLDQKDGLNQKLENWDGLMSHSTVVQESVWVNNSP